MTALLALWVIPWLLALGPGPPSVVLSWTPSVSPGVTSQCIYRGTAPGAENYTVAVVCIQNNTTATFTDRATVLQRGTTYYYTMQAAVGTDFSAPSNEVSALIPPAPGSPTVTGAVPH